MIYTISANDNIKINLAPTNIVEEILQNIAVILSTTKYSVPLDRKFGFPSHSLDKPLPVAEALIISEILDAIEEYEPRVEVLTIKFDKDEKIGKLIPYLEVKING